MSDQREDFCPFRGKAKLTQYMRSELASYRLNIWWMCDTGDNFPLKEILYTGEVGNTRNINQGQRVIKEEDV